MTVQQMIERLAAGEIVQELCDLAYKLAQEHLVGQRLKGFEPGDRKNAAWDLASNFIVHLHGSIGQAEIHDEANLRREFIRHLTRRVEGEDHELWHVLSDAIHALESMGVCVRPESERPYCNRNGTMWRLASVPAGTPWSRDAYEAASIPTYYPRIAKGVPGRVITPSDARQLLQRLLEAGAGDVSFGTLFQLAKNHVLMSKPGELPANDDDGHDEDPFAKIPDAPCYGTEHFIAMEEAEHRARLLWDEVSRKAKGAEVLCLYLLPKHLHGADVILADLGPPSTVNSQIAAIIPILRKCLFIEESPHVHGDDALREAIVSLTIAKINQSCSEKFPDSPFYSQ